MRSSSSVQSAEDTTITDPTTQPIKIDGYHAHVYYDPATRARAEQLRETIAGTLGVEVRELSDEPRGPHPVPQFRFMFTAAQFENIVPWLMLNARALTFSSTRWPTTPTKATRAMRCGSALRCR